MTATIEPTTDPNTIDAYAVALTETHNYFIEEEDRPFIREIRGIYLFDRNRHTHCCELTPSYELTYLYDQVVFVDDVPEERAAELVEKYEYLGGESRYVHCHAIDRMIAEADAAKVCHLGNPLYRTGRPIPPEDFDYDEIMESLRENYCANPVI